METTHIKGTAVAVVPFDYDMTRQGGPKGTSWSVYVVPEAEFGVEGTAPVKVKLPSPEMWSELLDAGFGAQVSIEAQLIARNNTIERRAQSVAVESDAAA
jgi:hypothetical protein